MEKYYFKNINTGAIITKKEYENLLMREHREAWEGNNDQVAEDLKEEGKTFEDYVEYMKKYNVDTDFVVVDVTGKEIN